MYWTIKSVFTKFILILVKTRWSITTTFFLKERVLTELIFKWTIKLLLNPLLVKQLLLIVLGCATDINLSKILRKKTLLASMAHECMDRTSWTSRGAEIPPPERRWRFEEAEESQPSGLSRPNTHAPGWQKVSFSFKPRRCAPQLPPASFSDKKWGP